MILSFKTAINGKPTYFIEKIWQTLFKMGIIGIGYANYLRLYRERFSGKEWDNACSFLFHKEEINPKLHTISEDLKGRWKVGMNIHPVIKPGGRYSKPFQFAPVIKCVSVQCIQIVLNNYPFESIGDPKWTIHSVLVGGKELNIEQVQQLAINDGFDSVEDFFAYFDKDFTGVLIHWTDLKY